MKKKNIMLLYINLLIVSMAIICEQAARETAQWPVKQKSLKNVIKECISTLLKEILSQNGII